eukprot:TRINITY_DN14350_c1_g1_i1.p2 TRINITY_DN14350_c1_g1~~TRINITY_DN14350_c1_g1_i1.p2  ORF type:complete len:122 (+),score=18.50 TRINITY_DN14350_c1_g1_i1:38-367(+)
MIRNLHQPQIQQYFLEVWELMIAEMEVRLKEADVPLASPEKIRKLDQIVAEYRLCMMRMAVINPIGMKLLGVQNQKQRRERSSQYREQRREKRREENRRIQIRNQETLQ